MSCLNGVTSNMGIILEDSRPWVSCGRVVVVLQGEFARACGLVARESADGIDADSWFAHLNC